jgi:pimeloyl-ACP methyl ester carboxylesterase
MNSQIFRILTGFALATVIPALSVNGQRSVVRPCNDSHAPVVFVHGFLGSGDTWAPQVQRFASNGLCADRFFAFDWNSLAGGGADLLLDRFIDSVLMVTGSEKVHLAGHSAGGGRGYSYLSDPSRAAKVISYVHIGSGANKAPAGPEGSVPTMNIYSIDDRIVPGGDIPGALNVRLTGLDHYQVATSAETFDHIYRFFYAADPVTNSIIPQERIMIGGRCLSLGTNQSSEGTLIDIFIADDGGNPSGQPEARLTVSANGNWGPVEVSPDHHYLFRLSSDRPGFKRINYYFEKFERDNPLAYLRTFPVGMSPVGLLLAALPNNDDLSVVSIFSSSQAMINGRDELSLNGIRLSTPALASAQSTMISLFCYDDRNDGQGTGEPIALFLAMPFLRGADIPIRTIAEETWVAEFNGRAIPVRNWSSKTDGVTIAVFW